MLNVIALMGRLVADPELKETTKGTKVTQFTIACERNFAAQGKERETDFFVIVAWRQAAEFACKYFRKGQLIAVNGRLQTRKYEDREGRKRTAHEIVAENLHFAEKKETRREEPAIHETEDANDFTVIDESEDLPF